MTYASLNGLIYLTKLVSGGRILPPDSDMAEYWTCMYSNTSSMLILLINSDANQ